MPVAPTIARPSASAKPPTARAPRDSPRVIRAGRSAASRLRLFSIAVIGYMLVALVWWSVLLYTKNQDAFEAKRALLELTLVGSGRVVEPTAVRTRPEYISLARSYRRQGYMIIGEAIVLMVSLAGGIYLVNHAYRKEVSAARQQRNFLLSITHELKSPLAGIQLALQTMRKRVLKADMRERLTDSALSETSRLTALVEDLLLSAKLDTSYEPTREPLDVRRVGTEWVERMRIKYPAIDFALQLDGEEFNVLADAYGISSVLGNLLENAVKYIGDGSHVELAICERGADVHIEVRDDGVGISDEEKARIFDKFYRVGNEDTRSTKGTGLGLYIVHEVVRAHGGSVEVRDHAPRGTVFAVCLPFGEADESP